MCYYRRFEPSNYYFHPNMTREFFWKRAAVTKQGLTEGQLTPQGNSPNAGPQTLLLSICQQLTVLWVANHLRTWPKLSNVLIYNPQHIFPATRKWTSRRLSGKNRVRTKRMGWFCRFQLNWDSSFHELSLPHNVLLSQGTPVSSFRGPSPLDGTE